MDLFKSFLELTVESHLRVVLIVLAIFVIVAHILEGAEKQVKTLLKSRKGGGIDYTENLAVLFKHQRYIVIYSVYVDCYEIIVTGKIEELREELKNNALVIVRDMGDPISAFMTRDKLLAILPTTNGAPELLKLPGSFAAVYNRLDKAITKNSIRYKYSENK